jgi:hypothetical protein
MMKTLIFAREILHMQNPLGRAYKNTPNNFAGRCGKAYGDGPNAFDGYLSGVAQSYFSPRKITLRYAMGN